MSGYLVKWDEARHAIAKAKSVNELAQIRAEFEALKYAAIQAKQSVEVINDAIEIKLRAERRAGEMLRESVKNPGGQAEHNSYQSVKPVSRITTLKDLKISSDQSSTWQKIAKVESDKFEDYVDSTKQMGVRLSSAGLLTAQVPKWTGEYEWYTPKHIIEAVRSVMGSIDVDPASSEEAQKTVRAVKHYTEEDNGLNQEWHGNVFLNPPYKMPHVELFSIKLEQEIAKFHVKQAIFLSNNSTDTRWWQALAKKAALTCFTGGRLKFYQKDEKAAAPIRGSSLMYFGDSDELFCDVFSQIGSIFECLSKD